MIRINFREYFYLYESIDQNFDQWLVDLKTHARPDESEIKTMSQILPIEKEYSLERQFIINTLKSKNVENKQYMKYLLGFATTPQSSHIEDYDRAVDTLKWFIQTNRLTKAQVEADGWFNTGKRATELTREKDQILNPASKTKEKKEKKLGIAEDISPLFQSGNIKIYFSPKATNQRRYNTGNDENAEKPEIKARHKILCKYGKDTDWCTASPTGTFHAMYADRNIYIVHIDDKPAYQFMDCTAEDTDDRCQFHDANNASAESIPLDLALLIKEKLPKVASFYSCVKNTFNKAIEDEIERGTSELIKDLIEKNAKVGDANYRAGKIRNLELIKDFVEKGIPVDYYKVNFGMVTGNLNIVDYLLEKGAKIDDGVVSKAAESNRLDLVKYLVDEKGVEIGGDAVSRASMYGNFEVVKHLVEKGGRINNAVSNAAGTGNLELVEYLVENGGKIDYGAVSKAVKTGNLPIVKYLVEKGGEIGSDAVSKAAGTGNLELVEYLVKKGGEIGDAVTYAADTGNLELVEYLVENGGKISYRAVFKAVKTGNLPIVKYLVEKGGEISDEAVSNAAYNGNLDLVNYLKSAMNRN